MKFLPLFLLCGAVVTASAVDKKIVLIAGTPSHGHLEHEHRAGCLLFQKCLASVPGVNVTVVSNGWPKDEKVLEGADAVVVFCTGGNGHLLTKPERRQKMDEVLKNGAGFGTMHYGVEIPEKQGGQEFLRWQGGYFLTNWSVNPHWTADFTNLPNHEITRGVKPFKIRDEWYYHMKFADSGVTPILSAIPPENTRGRPGANSTHGGNPEVQKRKGQAETVVWAYERPNGGRGFGFTGAHEHRNWADDNFRKVALNAILWIAKVPVPANGVESTVTQDDIMANLDPKGQKPKAAAVAPKAEPFISPVLPGK
jgi:hypothetical protein